MKTNTDHKNITGIILAGGKSSRMGQNKGLIRWKGKTFTEHIIKTLEAVTGEILIIANDPAYERFGLKVYPDLYIDKGPLAGIYTGLYHSVTDGNLVVSCDTPLVNIPLLNQLLDAAEEYDVCIPASEPGKWEPLIGYYHKRCMQPFRQSIEKGQLKMELAIRQMKHYVITLNDPGSAVGLKNFNTKEDLKHL